MLPQGVLGFQYEAECAHGGLTSLAGLPLYLDLVHSSGLAAAIHRQVQVAGRQGWLDIQMSLAVVFLNLAGGDCVEDLERLENDSGFAAILQAIERELLSRRATVVAAALAARTRTDGAIHRRHGRPGWSVSMIPRHSTTIFMDASCSDGSGRGARSCGRPIPCSCGRTNRGRFFARGTAEQIVPQQTVQLG